MGTRSAIKTTILTGMTAGKSYEVDRLAETLMAKFALDRDSAVDAVLVLVDQGYLTYDDNLDVRLLGQVNGTRMGSSRPVSESTPAFRQY